MFFGNRMLCVYLLVGVAILVLVGCNPAEPARNLLGLSRVKLLAREVGASSVTYRSDNLTVTGATAGSAALIRKATGGIVTTRTGRISVRAPELDPLTLAEESLRALTRAG